MIEEIKGSFHFVATSAMLAKLIAENTKDFIISIFSPISPIHVHRYETVALSKSEIQEVLEKFERSGSHVSCGFYIPSKNLSSDYFLRDSSWFLEAAYKDGKEILNVCQDGLN